MEDLILNHPYYIYPNAPLSEYIAYNLYNSESKRLYKHIDNINSNLINKTLIAILIGTTMEYSILTNQNERNTTFQWQQLFPSYIDRFIEQHSNTDIDYDETLKLYIYITIISPDDIFSDTNYHEPLFLKYKTNHIFVKVHNRKYICDNIHYCIVIDIFICPIPQCDSRIITNYDRILQDHQYDIQSYTQTDEDIIFINMFYDILAKLMQKMDYKRYFMIINSWVSFKNLNIQNYDMFKKVLELSNQHNILTTEWKYCDTLYSMKVVSIFKTFNGDKRTVHYNKNIIYVDVLYRHDLYCIDFSVNMLTLMV